MKLIFLREAIRKRFLSILLIASIGIYLLSHTLGLEHFPIYFFCDEAIQGVAAETLLSNGLRDETGTLLPTSIKNFFNYDLGFSVYANIPFVLLFGKNIWSVRLTTVLISLGGGIFISLMARNIFGMRNYWSAILFLLLTPIFFLHSRTGFETAIATSLYAGFLYFYLLYRTGRRKFLPISSLFAAASFYSYAGIWLVISLTIAVFFIVDIFYHLKKPKQFLLNAIFLILLFAPFIRTQLADKERIYSHLKRYESFLASGNSTEVKKIQFIKNYTKSFNPEFLFVYDKSYHPRHFLKGYGYFQLWSVPLILLGLLYLVLNLRKPASRNVLLALVISPISGVIIEPSPTRILPMVVTLTLVCCLGIRRLEKTIWGTYNAEKSFLLTSVLFGILSILSLLMTHDVLAHGPLWFEDYGLYGMQFGAKEIFKDTIPDYLSHHKNAAVYITPNFANGSDIFPKFFLKSKNSDNVRVQSINDFMNKKQKIYPDSLFILLKNEYENVIQSQLFSSVKPLKIIPYPNGDQGFFVLNLEYSPDAELRIQREKERRKQLVHAVGRIKENQVKFGYSLLSEGTIENILDRNKDSFIRGLEANPFILELEFEKPIRMNTLKLDFASMDFSIKIILYRLEADQPAEFMRKYSGLPDNPHIEFTFPQTQENIKKIRLEIRNTQRNETAEIHIREFDYD